MNSRKYFLTVLEARSPWSRCQQTYFLLTSVSLACSRCLLPISSSGLPSAAAAAKSLQSCLTLCDPIDGRPPGSSIPGILQARTLEWVAISVSNAWKWKVKGKSLSHVRLLVTPWTAAHQAPPPMGFSSQEFWSGMPLPSPGLPYRHTQICIPGPSAYKVTGHVGLESTQMTLLYLNVSL